jgi:putative peptidoglycan lipid II flippase
MRQILKTALLLLPVQVVLRGAEALMPLLLSWWFGRSPATDVYYVGFAFFQLIGSLLFGAFQDSAIVPILIETKQKGKSELEATLGSLFAHTVILGLALATAGALVGAVSLAFLYHGPELRLGLSMAPLLAGSLVLFGMRGLIEAWLIADQRYFAAPAARAFGVVTMLGLVALLHRQVGILIVPLATLAGELVSLVAVAIVAFGPTRVKLSPNLSRPEPVRRLARLVGSEVAGGAVTRINPLVDQLVAAIAGVAGGGTLLRYSIDVALAPTTLLQAVLFPVLLSQMSQEVAVGRVDRFRSTLMRSLLTVVGILSAVEVLLIVFRGPLLRLAFLRGAMDAAGVERMAHIFPYHVIGLAPFGALLVLARAHVALKNSRIMVSMGALNAALNAFFNLLLVRFMGLEGIALSTSLVHLAVAAVFFLRLETGMQRLGAVTPSP